MLERYFTRPATVDRIRSCWIGPQVEDYVVWLTEKGYAPRNVFRRVPLLVHFGEFAQGAGAASLGELPHHVEGFVNDWVSQRPESRQRRERLVKEARNPIEQMLRLALPEYAGRGRPKNSAAFHRQAPGFFDYLRQERGLRESSIRHYQHYLHRFETYLKNIGLDGLAALSPLVLSAFITNRAHRLAWSGLRNMCGVLKVFLRYAHREGLVAANLSPSVESPRNYRLSGLPRSITWEEVGRVLEVVDRRSAGGRRDYAILLLLVTYGLRAHEVAALRLDDIDWKRERLRVPERKAGHSTAFPLSPLVGNALLDYLQHGRPQTSDRHVFLRVVAPPSPVTNGAVVARASYYLRKAGLPVFRAGSHTLRHTCVQRLVDAELPLKTIGDYIGHRSPESTNIYAKVAVETLREVALGPGEDIL